MARENLQVMSGNRVAVLFDGKEVGLIQSLRCSDNYNLQPASGIGDIHVKEYVPSMASHSLSAATCILYRDRIGNTQLYAMAAAVDDGTIFDNGDSALRGVVFDILIHGSVPQGQKINTSFPNALTATEMQKTLRLYMDCSFEGGDIEIQKHAIIINNATFRALDATSDTANIDQRLGVISSATGVNAGNNTALTF